MNECFSPSRLSHVLGAGDPAAVVSRNLGAIAAHWGMTLGDVSQAGPSAAPAAVQGALTAITTRTGVALLAVSTAIDPEIVMEENFARLNAHWSDGSPVGGGGGGGGGSGPACALVTFSGTNGRGGPANITPHCATPGATIYLSDAASGPWTAYAGSGSVSVDWGDTLYSYAAASAHSDSGVTSWRNYSSGYSPV